MEPDILVGVKLLHTVIVGGDGGVSSGAVTLNTFWMINLSHLRTFGMWRASYVSVLVWLC